MDGQRIRDHGKAGGRVGDRRQDEVASPPRSAPEPSQVKVRHAGHTQRCAGAFRRWLCGQTPQQEAQTLSQEEARIVVTVSQMLSSKRGLHYEQKKPWKGKQKHIQVLWSPAIACEAKA